MYMYMYIYVAVYLVSCNKSTKTKNLAMSVASYRNVAKQCSTTPEQINCIPNI